ncbi:hypothetical protein ANANG_G00286260 [Anguilla anguilla]|uniref:Alcohol dehydrogenase-like C-terminal domain-containing protein n=1 Tax=Anguilla anguilla TaxID=7936 RepID=A0A9D3LKK8_ANGAN|nr:hypothetical protein ANANG_G00286260 [Anguilla anguilla]
MGASQVVISGPIGLVCLLVAKAMGASQVVISAECKAVRDGDRAPPQRCRQRGGDPREFPLLQHVASGNPHVGLQAGERQTPGDAPFPAGAGPAGP